MKARRRSSASSLRVRFSGSERDRAHRAWFRVLAEHYDGLTRPEDRARAAYLYLHDLFRRRGPVRDVLDMACGTFALDLPLLRRGYRVVGRDLSEDMLEVARGNLRAAGKTADLGRADMRRFDLGRTFDAVLCLGTAFNYLATTADVRAALASFRKHLRPRGLLVLDTTNFDAWIRNPRNVRADTDYRAPDGTRIAIFTLDDQDIRRRIHAARFLTAVRRGDRLDIGYSEAPLRIWNRQELDETLRKSGFRVAESAGDLRLGSRYVRRKSSRLVTVAERL